MTYAILDAVAPDPERAVLEVEYLEARVDILDELADLQWPLVVAERHGVDRQARELVNQADEREEVFLDR